MTFPIMPPTLRLNFRRASIVAIPFDLLKPHEVQAVRNHQQTLARLAERGGLSPCEALAVLEDRKYISMTPDESRDALIALVGHENVTFGRRY